MPKVKESWNIKYSFDGDTRNTCNSQFRRKTAYKRRRMTSNVTDKHHVMAFVVFDMSKFVRKLRHFRCFILLQTNKTCLNKQPNNCDCDYSQTLTYFGIIFSASGSGISESSTKKTLTGSPTTSRFMSVVELRPFMRTVQAYRPRDSGTTWLIESRQLPFEYDIWCWGEMNISISLWYHCTFSGAGYGGIAHSSVTLCPTWTVLFVNG